MHFNVKAFVTFSYIITSDKMCWYLQCYLIDIDFFGSVDFLYVKFHSLVELVMNSD